MFSFDFVCGLYYWDVDDTIQWDGPQHMAWLFSVGVPTLIFYGIILPGLSLFYMWRMKNRQTNIKLMFRYGLLYSGYAPRFWWWGGVEYARKLMMILIVTFARTNEQQLHICLGALVILLYVQENTRPFEFKEDLNPTMNARVHKMETASLLTLIAMVWCAVYFVINTCNGDDHWCTLTGFVVLGSNFIFVVWCGSIFVNALRKTSVFEDTVGKIGRVIKQKVKRMSTVTLDMNMNKRMSNLAKIRFTRQGRTPEIKKDIELSEMSDVRIIDNPMMRIELTRLNSRGGGGEVRSDGPSDRVSMEHKDALPSTMQCNPMKRIKGKAPVTNRGGGSEVHSGVEVKDDLPSTMQCNPMKRREFVVKGKAPVTNRGGGGEVHSGVEVKDDPPSTMQCNPMKRREFVVKGKAPVTNRGGGGEMHSSVEVKDDLHVPSTMQCNPMIRREFM